MVLGDTTTAAAKEDFSPAMLSHVIMLKSVSSGF